MRRNNSSKRGRGKGVRKPTKTDAHLPVPVNNEVVLPALSDTQQIQARLKVYARAVLGNSYSRREVDYVKRVLPNYPVLREGWYKHCARPATVTEIATNLRDLLNGDPALRNNAAEAAKLAERVSARHPSRYALVMAFNTLGDTEDWITRRKIVRTLIVFENQCRYFSRALDKDPQAYLDDATAEWQERQRAEERARRRQEKEEAAFVAEYGMPSEEYYWRQEGGYYDELMADLSEPARQRNMRYWQRELGADWDELSGGQS